jgi:hypothetical protein
MVHIFPSSARRWVLAIVLAMLTIASACGETIDITWKASGTFHGTPTSGTIVMQFTSSAPFDFVESRGSYTGDLAARRSFGPFEITARGGDKLRGRVEIFNAEPYRPGKNFGSGTFTFTGGTGQFAGATGHGTIDGVTTLPPFPTNTGGVEQEMRGILTLVPPMVPGDYNRNGIVDAADYVVWRKNDGTPAGYDAWRANFGANVTSADHVAESVAASWESAVRRGGLPIMSAVPEPSSILFVVELVVLLAVMPKRVGAH